MQKDGCMDSGVEHFPKSPEKPFDDLMLQVLNEWYITLKKFKGSEYEKGYLKGLEAALNIMDIDEDKRNEFYRKQKWG